MWTKAKSNDGTEKPSVHQPEPESRTPAGSSAQPRSVQTSSVAVWTSVPAAQWEAEAAAAIKRREVLKEDLKSFGEWAAVVGSFVAVAVFPSVRHVFHHPIDAAMKFLLLLGQGDLAGAVIASLPLTPALICLGYLLNKVFEG